MIFGYSIVHMMRVLKKDYKIKMYQDCLQKDIPLHCVTYSCMTKISIFSSSINLLAEFGSR